MITDEFGKISVELPFGTYLFHQLNSIKNYSGNVLKQKILSYFIDKGYDKKAKSKAKRS